MFTPFIRRDIFMARAESPIARNREVPALYNAIIGMEINTKSIYTLQLYITSGSIFPKTV